MSLLLALYVLVALYVLSYIYIYVCIYVCLRSACLHIKRAPRFIRSPLVIYISMYMYVLVYVLTHYPARDSLAYKKGAPLMWSPMYLCSRCLPMSLPALYVLVYVCLCATCFTYTCIRPYKKGIKKAGFVPA
ncbi:hypothetical protein FORC83_p068 (plasmid) [Campylobacter jejuni]|nr:hypothetical protein FORC83_p068 [Campylobacter jejuni]